ncbi:MAG: hypothetical protein M3Y33_18275 [Actinomycetota bacterium]|nr:hypothetical protein [Actinomycetota bacterium]
MIAEHAERLGGPQLVMSWPEVLEPRGEGTIGTAEAPDVVFAVRRYGDIGPA